MSDLLLERISSVVSSIGRDSSTALVRIATPTGQRMAFFEDGALVFFVSDHPREWLRDFLVEDGRLSSPDEREAVSRMDQSKLVAHIVDAGLADAERLMPWLSDYALQSVARLYGEREGTVKVMTGMRADHAVRINIAATDLILASVRALSDVELVRDAVGPVTATATPAADHMDRLLALPLNFQEGMVGSQITLRIALAEVLTVSGIPEIEALKALLALRLVGVLEPFEEPKELTDTGRLRRRKEALDAGVAVDVESAAVLLGVERGKTVGPEVSQGPVSMEELERAMFAPEPERPAGPIGSEGIAPPRGRRGNTGQLKLLASAYVEMARSEVKARNFNGAVQYFEQALHQNPDDLDVTIELARLLLTKSQTVGAAERLVVRACDAHRYSAIPRVLLAEIYRDSGRHAQAAQAIADAERIEPDSPAVRAYAGKGKGGMFSRLRS